MRAIAREMITGRRAAGLASQIARDSFITGLRNAHAMEVQARDLAERQSERLYRTAGDGIPPAPAPWRDRDADQTAGRLPCSRRGEAAGDERYSSAGGG